MTFRRGNLDKLKDTVPNQFVIGFNADASLPTVRTAVNEVKQGHPDLYDVTLIKTRFRSSQVISEVNPSESVTIPLSYIVVEVKGSIERFLTNTRQIAGVKFVEPRHYVRVLDGPNDPMYVLQHALPRAQLPSAWARGASTSSPVVAVVDTGIDYTHPDLTTHFGSLKGYDFVDDDSDPVPDASWESHGTHVAGIIAASRDNDIGIAGAAPAILLSTRAINEEGEGIQDNVADAINWAVSQGAQIINLSLGGSADSVLEAAVENAWDNGALLVAASGNAGEDTISYPAAYEAVIAVGALDWADNLASFSSYGAQQELVAPGTAILSTYPQNDYAVAKGTSTASPLVAGIAALVLSHEPSLTNNQLRAILTRSADDLGEAGWDSAYGYGRVNAFAALNQVLDPLREQELIVQNTGQALLEVNNVTHNSNWLTVASRTFTIWPGSDQTVYVMVDASDLSADDYKDTLIIHSNDPDEPTFAIDVGLLIAATNTPTVTPTPTNTPTATSSQSPTPTNTFTPTATKTSTSTETPILTVTSTSTSAEVPTATVTATASHTPTPTFFEVALSLGWNHVSLPLSLTVPYNAQSLIDEVNSQGGCGRDLPLAGWWLGVPHRRPTL